MSWYEEFCFVEERSNCVRNSLHYILYTKGGAKQRLERLAPNPRMPVSVSLNPTKGSRCFLDVTLIVQYWLVPGTDSTIELKPVCLNQY